MIKKKQNKNFKHPIFSDSNNERIENDPGKINCKIFEENLKWFLEYEMAEKEI